MALQAADANFIAAPALVGVVILFVIITAVYWYNTHCPNCKRIFTRETVKKSKVGRLPRVLSDKERRHYRCKNCGHEWDKVIYLGD